LILSYLSDERLVASDFSVDDINENELKPPDEPSPATMDNTNNTPP